MGQRDFDLVVFGVTGLTGRMVAKYLADLGDACPVRWAVAGRNRGKLDALVAELGVEDLPVVVADSHDEASLRAMAASTTAIITTVGPYARYGTQLVAACVEEGTHYGDLTGEVHFVRSMIDAHHEAAAQAGVRIVHCCGFDSIPTDLGVFVLQNAAIERHGAPCPSVENVVWRVKGGVSGGTVASFLATMKDASDPAVRRTLADPYSLAPGHARGPDTRVKLKAMYSEAAEAWTAPFVMAPVNERVVRRSNALLDHRYGTELRVKERMRTPSRFAAMRMTAALAATATMAIPPIRWLAQRTVLPAPGEGPSDDAIENGMFEMRLFGSAPQGAKEGVEVWVRGRRDPGYGATACMLAESGICLATEPDLPMAGVITPAAAMGEALTERLNATDVTFQVMDPA